MSVFLALFVRTFVVEAFEIPSGSMRPTLQEGDCILALKPVYGLKMPWTGRVLVPVAEPERGDVVVFDAPPTPGQDYVKRVVAVAGDTVETRNGRLRVNGRPLADDPGRYDPAAPKGDFGPVRVPPGKLFVMGDNRNHSFDSRYWGFVDLEAVRGRAVAIYWSWDPDGWGVRWSRMGRIQ